MNMTPWRACATQLGNERVNDVKNYIRKGKLWEAFTPMCALSC
jgi:hypothetical protein